MDVTIGCTPVRWPSRWKSFEAGRSPGPRNISASCSPLFVPSFSRSQVSTSSTPLAWRHLLTLLLSPSASIHVHTRRWVSRSRMLSVSKLFRCSALRARADHDIDHNAVSVCGRISSSYGPVRGSYGRQMETIEFDLRSTSPLPSPLEACIRVRDARYTV